MKITTEFRQKFSNLLELQSGVLNIDDLWAIISPSSAVDFYRQVKKLKGEKLIRKVIRGFYVGERFSLPSLVMTLRPESYLSLEYALARYNLIGTYSDEKVRPIISARVRAIRTEFISIEFKAISSDLMFGIDVLEGIRIATKEKALLDTLYFYQKGTSFYFDIYSDIDLSTIDRSKVAEYLKKYKNPKFVKFVEDYLND